MKDLTLGRMLAIWLGMTLAIAQVVLLALVAGAIVWAVAERF